MRRLRIIDLEGGDQPISNEDQTIWVIFNGEIYNHEELRSDLVAAVSLASETELFIGQLLERPRHSGVRSGSS